MNVSLTEPMEKFIRHKVAVGEYETASEVVRDALRLLRKHDEAWKGEVDAKIKAGLASAEAGRLIPLSQVREEMKAFKKNFLKKRKAN